MLESLKKGQASTVVGPEEVNKTQAKTKTSESTWKRVTSPNII